MRREAGFTLVEMMIALLIFGLLAAAGVSVFAYSVRAQESAARRLAATGDEARMIALLTADLSQATLRRARSDDGPPLPPFALGGGDRGSMAFVRGGVASADEDDRSSLRRVDWRLDGDRLVRSSRDHVDGSGGARSLVLATGVESLRLRVRSRGFDWTEDWRYPDRLPLAVELTLKRRGVAPLVMAFMVGAA